MRKFMAVFLTAALLISSFPLYALEDMDLSDQRQEELDLGNISREDVRGEEYWKIKYPHGMFNFAVAQFEIDGSQDVYKMAVARQGGTRGEVSVDFKAIDMSVKYGEDYVIRTGEDKADYEIRQNEDAFPLMDALDNNETNISNIESDHEGTDTEDESLQVNLEDYLNDIETSETGDNNASETEHSYSEEDSDRMAEEDTGEGEGEGEGDNASSEEGVTGDAVSSEDANKGPKSLRQLREEAFGEESDRPSWREANLELTEEVKKEHDELFQEAPGTETTIEFADGEYIKYLYIIPLGNDDHIHGQSLFTLTNPAGGAVRGDTYMVTIDFVSDEYDEWTLEIDSGSANLRDDGKAEVTVRRAGGDSYYAAVTVGTVEGSAKAGEDYVPGLQEILFTPGMTEQAVTVDILENSKRAEEREFFIALDRTNQSVNPEKATATIAIPPDLNNVSAFSREETAQSAQSESESARVHSAGNSTSSGVERISKHGSSPGKGNWLISGEDFMEGKVKGSVNDIDAFFSTVSLDTKGTDTYVDLQDNVKFYGVERLTYTWRNTGQGRIEEVNKWPWWNDNNNTWRLHDEFRTTFDLRGSYSSSHSRVYLSKNGLFGRPGIETESINVGVGAPLTIYRNLSGVEGSYLWDITRFRASTKPDNSKSRSQATFSSFTLDLIEYNLKVKNNTDNVPEFKIKRYEIEKDEPVVAKEKSGQPGEMYIKAVHSNVNNEQTGEIYETGVYRSDLIEFGIKYEDDIIGQNSSYVGFEVYTVDDEWKRFNGRFLSLDEEIFKQNPEIFQREVLDEDPHGTPRAYGDPYIKVRPVFEQNKANLDIEIDADQGGIEGLVEGTSEKSFTGFNRGDIITVSAKPHVTAITPTWAVENSSAVIDKVDDTELVDQADETGHRLDYRLTRADNWLAVDFFNPDLIVQAHPYYYKHRVSQPVYTFDGQTFENHEPFREKMQEVYDTGDVDVDISLSFEYLFDENYPTDKTKDDFSPREAVLTVYNQEGLERESYIISHDGDGSYEFSGNLKELEWQLTDFATLHINDEDGWRKTEPIVIDFLQNTRGAVAVELPEGDTVGGDIYDPLVIENVDPFERYDMYAFLPPGFVAQWRDRSLDVTGDGFTTGDETGEYADIMDEILQKYGTDLRGIDHPAVNPAMANWIYGSQLGYTPRWFNPSKIYFWIQRAEERAGRAPAELQVMEQHTTVLNPQNRSNEIPVEGALVFIDGETLTTDERGIVAPETRYRDGDFVAARIYYGGYDYLTSFEVGQRHQIVIPSNEMMIPKDFIAEYREEDGGPFQDVELGSDNTLLDIREGSYRFTFRVDPGLAGAVADDAVIRIKRDGEEVYSTNTGPPEHGVFEFKMNLVKEGVLPNDNMTIAPMHNETEYMEKDVGLVFSKALDLFAAFVSFDTPVQPVLEFLGDLRYSLNLGSTLDFEDYEQDTRVDAEGKEFEQRIAGFGFDFFDVRRANKKSAKRTFIFRFNTENSLALRVEPRQYYEDGLRKMDVSAYYFSRLDIETWGEAGIRWRKVIPTPIIVPVQIAFNARGTVDVRFRLEPLDDRDRYSDKFKLIQDEDDEVPGVPLFKSDHVSYDSDVRLNLEATLEGGVGMDEVVSVSAGGGAIFDFNYTSPVFEDKEASDGIFRVSDVAYVAVRALFGIFEQKWETSFTADLDDMRPSGLATAEHPLESHAYEPVKTITEDEIMPRDYLQNSSGWLGSDSSVGIAGSDTAAGGKLETILEKGAYPYPQTELVELEDGNLMALFISDPGETKRDKRNRARLLYTIYDKDEGTWSEPLPVDPEGKTWDESPDAFVIGDRVLVTWVDAAREFNEDDTVIDVLSALNISGMWFNKETMDFEGEKLKITKGTDHDEEYDEYADVKPMVSYDSHSGRLMVYYTKMDYRDPNEYEIDDRYQDWDEAGGEETLAMMGDIGNPYSLIAYRYAEEQEDGSFEWNTGYEQGESYPAHLYGQRFLNLATLVDIEETEIVDEDGVVTGIEQEVTAAEDPDTDPLIEDSDLITYNQLALHAYVMDGDGSRSTTADQELYLQIYNYELDEFHHPIRLTNNNVQDTQPRFVRTGDITYLYWLSGGDIVYMDITDLIRNNLKAVEVEINGETRSMYIADKSDAGKDGLISTVVDGNWNIDEETLELLNEEEANLGIDHFQIQSNREGQYIIFTDSVISEKEEYTQSNSGASEGLQDVNLERHIFAAYSEPRVKLEHIPVDDAFIDTDEYEFVYAEGKGEGTYPEKIIIHKEMETNIFDGEGEALEVGEHVINWDEVPDANGFRGVVAAGDPVLQSMYSPTKGYDWSNPVQITDKPGANYSDISFVVNEDQNIHATYIRYIQELNEEKGYFEPDESKREFASAIFDVTGEMILGEIALSNELPQAGDRLTLTAEVTNNDVRPITQATAPQYKAYMKQDGEITEENEPGDLLSDDPEDHLLGGESQQIAASFELPADLSNVEVGFKLLDENGDEILKTGKILPEPEAGVQISILDRVLEDGDTAWLQLHLENIGNKEYDGPLTVSCLESGEVLKEVDIKLGIGESKTRQLNVDIDPDMFGETTIAEDGSALDELGLEIAAGYFTQSTIIRREADESVVEIMDAVTSFSLDEDDFTLNAKDYRRLEINKTLDETDSEDGADDLDVRWSSSNRDVAAVLQDGTVIGLSPGTAEITASLTPRVNRQKLQRDGTFEVVNPEHVLPAGMIRKETITVTVTEAPITYGDVSGDGEITIKDAILALRHIVGLITLDEEQQIRADVTGNDIINVQDAVLILRRTAGIIDQFPVEKEY